VNVETSVKSQKQEAIDLIQRLPDEVGTVDIIEEVYFKLQIDDGLKGVAKGRTLRHDELKKRLH
jgi:hypothetical protein